MFQFAGTPSISLSNTTHDGDGYDDIAWDAVAFQPLSAKPANFVVAMGDSYSSGEGASVNLGESYYNETDNNGGVTANPSSIYYNNINGNTDLKYNRERNACHRSTEAWSRKANIPGSTQTIGAAADSYGSNMDYQFIACSGAQTENVLPYFTASSAFPTNAWGQSGRYGKYREDSQMDRGYLDANTTLVTLTIGGNDARFGEVIQACAGYTNCSSTVLPGDTAPLPAAQNALIPKVQSAIVTILKQIATRAPNAKILIQGYPMLFEQGGSCVLVSIGQFSWLNQFARDLNSSINAAVDTTNASLTSRRVKYVDAQARFSGHNLCSDQEDARVGSAGHDSAVYGQSALNGLVLTDLTPGDADFWGTWIVTGSPVVPSAQSIHPNKFGTDLYAQAMNAAMSPW
ncbi:SGNH/GDSL hydrolase family protein [Rathayibacter sp. AY1A7]|uniref:SGNH/GDSL hydrolase family protein n=1 Tax=Rathayibacter sp. AY1A7 TaxID=2080524 RepID=UPI000CE83413|nr:SGNH/GDSL hydrolase family protein [Rathayibacter sp. AY1A7]PPF20842.1 hypothetical protein C5B95_07195 [Rathayibacter sp. AY1A7]